MAWQGTGGAGGNPRIFPPRPGGPDEAADEVTFSHPGVPRWGAGVKARPCDKGLKGGVEGLADTGSHGM